MVNKLNSETLLPILKMLTKHFEHNKTLRHVFITVWKLHSKLRFSNSNVASVASLRSNSLREMPYYVLFSILGSFVYPICSHIPEFLWYFIYCTYYLSIYVKFLPHWNYFHDFHVLIVIDYIKLIKALIRDTDT